MMIKLKSAVALLLALLLLCSCAPATPNGQPEEDENAFNFEDEMVPVEEPVVADDVETEDVLPDYDDDVDDDILPIEDPEAENDNGVVLTDPVTYTNQEVSAKNDEFMLTLLNAKDVYTTDDNIEAEAWLALIGAEELTVWSGDPIVTFTLEGDTCFNDYQGAGMTMDILMSTKFTNLEDAIFPYTKSGGWSTYTDPYRDFYSDFFSDRDSFKLPAGNYTLTVHANYSLDENDVIGTSKALSASVSFTVVGKTLEDMGYYPKEPEEQPTEEVVVTEDDALDTVPEEAES